MTRSRFTTEQIIAILRKHTAGNAPKKLIRLHGISRPTFFTWKKLDGELQVSDARRLTTLEDENRRLKRLVAYQALNRQILKGVLEKGQ